MQPMQPTPPEERESAYELFQRGSRMLAEHHPGAAAVLLERALALEPGKASILEALGRAYFNVGSHELAAERFAAIVEADPVAHYAHFGLGLSKRADGRRHRRPPPPPAGGADEAGRRHLPPGARAPRRRRLGSAPRPAPVGYAAGRLRSRRSRARRAWSRPSTAASSARSACAPRPTPRARRVSASTMVPSRKRSITSGWT